MRIFLGLCLFVVIIESGRSESGTIDGTLSEIDSLLTVNKRAERGRCELKSRFNVFLKLKQFVLRNCIKVCVICLKRFGLQFDTEILHIFYFTSYLETKIKAVTTLRT